MASIPFTSPSPFFPSPPPGERQVAEAGELLEQLEVDVGDLSAEERNAARKRLQSYKQQLSEAEAKLKRSAVALSGGAAARNELFAYDGTSDDSVRGKGGKVEIHAATSPSAGPLLSLVSVQRAALVTNTERLSRTTTRLDDGYRTAVETQEVAVGIMENLHTQRETIQRSRTRVSAA